MKGHEILSWNIYCVCSFYQVVRLKTDVFSTIPEALNNDMNVLFYPSSRRYKYFK